MQARVSRKLHDRLEGLPQIVRDIAWKARSGSAPDIVGSRRPATQGRRDDRDRAGDGGIFWAIARQTQIGPRPDFASHKRTCPPITTQPCLKRTQQAL